MYAIAHVTWKNIVTEDALTRAHRERPMTGKTASIGGRRDVIVVSARFIDASMHRDTCHAIRIAIQLTSIAILKKKSRH